MENKKQDVISVPKEVVIEILRRVPGHDLAEKLKMVCMQWCSIIHTGSFAYLHIEQRIKSSSFSQLEAVIVAFDGNENRSVTVSSLEWHNSYNQNDHQFEDWKTKHLFTAKDVLLSQNFHPWMSMIWVNSVNGFVCFWSFFDKTHFHVFNPVTKEYLITAPNTYLGVGNIDLATIVGFGFCPLSYEYKVVVLDRNSEVIKPSIFTIGTDHSWRALKVIPRHNISDVVTAVYLKGILYWYANTCTSTIVHSFHTKTLLCFDVTKEEFDMIVVPIEIPEYSVTNVVEKGEKLCLVTLSCGPICSLLINVYVAHNNIDDDLSNLNSWKKEFTVTAPSIAYKLDLDNYNVYTIIVTDEIVVIQLGDNSTDCGFFHVATGKLLGLFSTTHATLIPYKSSLVAFCHRPLLPSLS
ncbi:putative F-box protein At1g32420 [Solanum stenotomum]|uniref:putative F-box protein At1g32420 n=1 Tax=Solanum stenotomum TaxID=172797 RepID=UPI0020D138E6|nr:putative F-box protein At1g32420 [Solanum stenotomum]